MTQDVGKRIYLVRDDAGHADHLQVENNEQRQRRVEAEATAMLREMGATDIVHLSSDPTPRDSTFQSADGSVRCARCHLHPDLCACDTSRLTAARDGLDGCSLGIISVWQYALTFPRNQAGSAYVGDVFRRRSDEAGTYGGWRWEFGSYFPAQYAATVLELAELAQRIELAISAERSDVAEDETLEDCYPGSVRDLHRMEQRIRND